MKRARFSEGQIVAILKQSEAGMNTAEYAGRTASAKPLSTMEGKVRRHGCE